MKQKKSNKDAIGVGVCARLGARALGGAHTTGTTRNSRAFSPHDFLSFTRFSRIRFSYKYVLFSLEFGTHLQTLQICILNTSNINFKSSSKIVPPADRYSRPRRQRYIPEGPLIFRFEFNSLKILTNFS